MTHLIGTTQTELLDWLAETWWKHGPSVCIIEGFPGVGKTQMAESLDQRLRAGTQVPQIVFVQCPTGGVGVGDDFLLSAAQAFAEQGDERLANNQSFLSDPVLLVIDEFQASFATNPSRLPPVLTQWLDKLSKRYTRGRILLLTSREIERGQRWSERCEIRPMAGLSVADGSIFLEEWLQREGLSAELLPENRRSEVVKWLGGYPRALRLLVSRLKRDFRDTD